MGVLDKVVISFESRFWDKKTQSIMFEHENIRDNSYEFIINMVPFTKENILYVFNGGPNVKTQEKKSDK